MDIRISTPQCFSEIGGKTNQEDSLFPAMGEAMEKQRIFIVCDGMGGHDNGEVASKCVADTIGEMTSSVPECTTDEMKRIFEEALTEAYRRLDEMDKNETSVKTMGTTLVFLAICTDGLLTAHIGDSRIYQMRKRRGVIFQTRDHSLVNDLLASGELDEKSARHFSQKNVITRAIQPHQEYPAKATYNVITDVRKDDVFLLCSDGVVEKLENIELVMILLANGKLSDRMERLKRICQKRDTNDNHSCYAFEITYSDQVIPYSSAKTRHTATYAMVIMVVAVFCAIAYFIMSD